MSKAKPQPKPPESFTDAAGREWRPRLDYIKLEEILKQKPGVDLGNVESMAQTWAKLLQDDKLALAVIWIAIDGETTLQNDPRRKEEPAKEITFREWLATMNGETLEAARWTLKGAIESFTPPPKRALMLRGLEAVEKGWQKTLEVAEQRVADEIEPAIARAMKQVQQHGTPASKSPAPLVTSTTAGRSAKRNKR